MQQVLPDEILKVDRRGRVRVPVARREALLDEFERCGVSALQFATQIGVKYPTFASWVVQRRRKKAAAGQTQDALKPMAPTGMRWTEAVVEQRGVGYIGKGGGPRGLTIVLPGGARMEIDESAQLSLVAELLRMLESRDGRLC